MTDAPRLFTPLAVRGRRLANRLVMGSMHTGLEEAPDGLARMAAFYAERAVWRAARTASGARFVIIEELSSWSDDAKRAHVVYTPARLHGDQRRFSAAKTGHGTVLLRDWHDGHEVLGFTITQEQP